MTEQPTPPKAPTHGGIGSLISFSAIIVAALVAATTALIRPYLEASTESTLLVAVFLSVGTTTSKSIYTAYVGKIAKDFRGRRRWRSILLAGLLAGLAACLVGIVGTSAVELATGKEPSISPNGTQVIPISPPAAMGGEPSISPPAPTTLISFYYDLDGDKLGSGDPVKYERGSQPFGWVEQSGDKCPDIPGSVELQGCPYGPDTCIQGYVWREAFTGDHVCVTPQTRAQAADDTLQAQAYWEPGGGLYGPDTCIQGYVWREAHPGDHVCVLPAKRAKTAEDNSLAASRRVATN
jgi:hypothetical protein